jgi:hypothetical protein
MTIFKCHNGPASVQQYLEAPAHGTFRALESYNERIGGKNHSSDPVSIILGQGTFPAWQALKALGTELHLQSGYIDPFDFMRSGYPVADTPQHIKGIRLFIGTIVENQNLHYFSRYH